MSNAPAATTGPLNKLGLVGLGMVVLGTILSPTGMFVITLPIIAILGFGGMIICIFSLGKRPRWPGVTGLVVGVLCCVFWIGLVIWGFATALTAGTSQGLPAGTFPRVSMDAVLLTESAEYQRQPSGAPAATIDLSALPPANLVDPWGRPYRYVLVDTPRGFTFRSDGADGVAGSADDIDILTLERPRGVFELPPISVPTAPPAAPATP
jgi:hypothetical protein